MSNVKFRSAAEQCNEYVDAQRLQQKRAHADRLIRRHVAEMQREVGITLTLGALIRYVGCLLVDGTNRRAVAQCRRFLAKCIALSVMKGLTPRPIRH